MRIRNVLFILTLLLILISCKSGHISKKELQVQYDNLTKENQRLNDSISELISQFKYDSIKPKITLNKSPIYINRGIFNEFHISLEGATSIHVSSKSGHIEKISGMNNFKIAPGRGRYTPININAKMLNGETLSFIDSLKIKNIGSARGYINGYSGNIWLTKKELKNAIISVKMDNYLYNHMFNVYGFKIMVPNNPYFKVEGNTIIEDVYESIKESISIGDELYIYDIHMVLKEFRGCVKTPSPIHIRIIED